MSVLRIRNPSDCDLAPSSTVLNSSLALRTQCLFVSTSLRVSIIDLNVSLSTRVTGDGSDLGEECMFPFSHPQFLWKCHVNSPLVNLPLEVDALIDNGSSLVLIDEGVVMQLGLQTHQLHRPVSVGTAFSSSSMPQKAMVSRYINLSLSSIDSRFHSCTVCAIIVPSLCKPIIPSVPFLE